MAYIRDEQVLNVIRKAGDELRELHQYVNGATKRAAEESVIFCSTIAARMSRLTGSLDTLAMLLEEEEKKE